MYRKGGLVMKKLGIILGSVFMFGAINAQNSFPTSNAIWNYGVEASDWFSGKNDKTNIAYTICGDTIMDGIIYNKLYTTLDTVSCGENLETFLGCFRQDGKKVFFIPYYKAYSIYPAYFGKEFLVYDFGVSVGDTVVVEYGFRYYFWRHDNYERGYHHFMDYDPMDRMLVVSNIVIENEIKKIYLGSEDIWYEGIGSPYGLFNAGKVDATDGYSFGFSLNCFKQNDTVKYLNNPKCNKCFCSKLDIPDNKLGMNFVNMFPNPVKDMLNVEIPKNIEIKSISILDIDGKLIHRYETIYWETVIQLNISNFKKGSYIINLETDKGNFNQIIIKN